MRKLRESSSTLTKEKAKNKRLRLWITSGAITLIVAIAATVISVIVEHPWPAVFASLMAGVIYAAVEVEKRIRA